MIKILVVDDHAVVRSGIRQFLSCTHEFEVVEEAASGEQGLALALQARFDVVILDINLPDINGLEVLKRIRRKMPKQPVLIFSMLDEEDFAMPALSAGASGYLSKDSSPDDSSGLSRMAMYFFSTKLALLDFFWANDCIRSGSAQSPA